jgi:N6-adenosine-specific RNA methylase IME4
MPMAQGLFNPLPLHSYDLGVIDSPWHFKVFSEVTGIKKSAQSHYRVMSLADIKKLPVRGLLKPDAVLFTWATAPLLPAAIEAMGAWGVTYKSNLVWRKTTRNSKVRMACGFWARSMQEHVLIGTVGKPPLLKFPSLFDGVAREHSRKPDEFYQMIVKQTPGYRRADIFARGRRDGFDGWGDELDRFSKDGIGIAGRIKNPPDCIRQAGSIFGQ